jgi:hypothetical protein
LYADARGFSQILDQDFKKSAFICEICVPFAPMSGSEEPGQDLGLGPFQFVWLKPSA